MNLEPLDAKLLIAVWCNLVEACKNDFTPEELRGLLKLDFKERTRKRIEKLGARAEAGKCNFMERDELQAFSHVSGMLGVLHIEARILLDRASSEP